MRRCIALAVAAVGLFGLPHAASGQRLGYYIERSFDDAVIYDEGYDAPRTCIRGYDGGPAVYGYVHRRAPVGVDIYYSRPVHRNGCSRYQNWDSDDCVDARDRGR